MAKKKAHATAAIRVLRAHGVGFVEHEFAHQDKGGTALGAAALGVDEHAVIKTLIMEDERKNPLIVLMHGDRQVSTKRLARQLNVKAVTPCTPASANKHSGYVVGGTSPFGTRRTMPVYIEASVLELPMLYINGGRRGYLLQMKPQILQQILKPTPVTVAI